MGLKETPQTGSRMPLEDFIRSQADANGQVDPQSVFSEMSRVYVRPDKTLDTEPDGSPMYRDPSYASASTTFERQTGMTGISKQWKMPDDMPYRDVELAYRDDFNTVLKQARIDAEQNAPQELAGEDVARAQGRVADLHKRIGELNPEFQNLEVTGRADMAHQCLGSISQYNPDDIDDFTKKVGKPRDGAYNERLDRISKDPDVNAEFEWKPSPKTLDKIEAQIQERRLPNTPNANNYASLRTGELADLSVSDLDIGGAQGPSAATMQTATASQAAVRAPIQMPMMVP